MHRMRVFAVVALLVLSVAGCGLVSGRSERGGAPTTGGTTAGTDAGTVDDRSPLPEILALVRRSAGATFTAEYKGTGTDAKRTEKVPGVIVLIRQPPVTGAISRLDDGSEIRNIWTPTESITCGRTASGAVCERKGPSEHLDLEGTRGSTDWANVFLDDNAAQAHVLDPFEVLSDLETAVEHGTAEVNKSTETIAGQKSSCVKTLIRGVTSDLQVQYDACFTQDGIVSYLQSGLIGKDSSITFNFKLVSYSANVDAALLKPFPDATMSEG